MDIFLYCEGYDSSCIKLSNRLMLRSWWQNTWDKLRYSCQCQIKGILVKKQQFNLRKRNMMRNQIILVLALLVDHVYKNNFKLIIDNQL